VSDEIEYLVMAGSEPEVGFSFFSEGYNRKEIEGLCFRITYGIL